MQVEEVEGLGGALFLRSNIGVQRCPSTLSNHAQCVGELTRGPFLQDIFLKAALDVLFLLSCGQTLQSRESPAPPLPKTSAQPPH